MNHCAYYETPLGTIRITHQDGAVTGLCLENADWANHHPGPVSDLAAAEVLAYLAGRRNHFTFAIRPEGTAFQKAVWSQLLTIPYGQTRSYGQIAASLGRPKSARAVGMACSRNPIWIAIPCHRVIGKNGTLTGYAGGLSVKQVLLDLEQHNEDTPEAT